MMKFKAKTVKGVTVIELAGNVMGGPDASALNQHLHDLVSGAARQVVIDLGGVKFINSSGLGMLIGGSHTMRNAGGELKLARPSKKIEDLLEMTRLNNVFDIHKSVSAAVTAFNGGKK